MTTDCSKSLDVKVGYQGRSPLLAFCDAMMSSVKTAAKKPNEGLSLDCAKAGLNENRLDLIYHWLTQDKSVASGDTCFSLKFSSVHTFSSHTHTCMHKHVHMLEHTSMHKGTHTNMHAYTHTCMHVCTRTHTHTCA